MDAFNILNMLHKSINISYNVEVSSDKDSITFRYTVGGTPYTMQFENITGIKTEKEAKLLIDVIKSNIQYHINELENKLQ